MNPKLRNTVAGLGIVGSALFPVKEAVTQSIDVSNYTGKYMFWAVPFSEKIVNQPSISTNYKNFSTWTMVNFDPDKGVNEFDFLGDVSIPLNSKVNLSAGAVYFPSKINGKWEHAANLYTRADFNVPLSPSVVFNKLVGNCSGHYIATSLSKNFKVGKNLTANVSGELGYNDNAFIDGRGFSHVETKATLPINKGRFTFSPFVSNIKSFIRGIENRKYGGVNLNYNFR